MASPAIRDFAYDENRNELTVTFSTGRTYVYLLVPPGIFAAFNAAASKGSYHNAHIRDRYPFRKVGTERATGTSAALRDALRRSAGK